MRASIYLLTALRIALAVSLLVGAAAFAWFAVVNPVGAGPLERATYVASSFLSVYIAWQWRE